MIIYQGPALRQEKTLFSLFDVKIKSSAKQIRSTASHAPDLSLNLNLLAFSRTNYTTFGHIRKRSPGHLLSARSVAGLPTQITSHVQAETAEFNMVIVNRVDKIDLGLGIINLGLTKLQET
jgi:hypothetical protein